MSYLELSSYTCRRTNGRPLFSVTQSRYLHTVFHHCCIVNNECKGSVGNVSSLHCKQVGKRPLDWACIKWKMNHFHLGHHNENSLENQRIRHSMYMYMYDMWTTLVSQKGTNVVHEKSKKSSLKSDKMWFILNQKLNHFLCEYHYEHSVIGKAKDWSYSLLRLKCVVHIKQKMNHFLSKYLCKKWYVLLKSQIIGLWTTFVSCKGMNLVY